MKHGICGLCKLPADLHDSHLLPSALYKLMKAPALNNPNPVRVMPGAAVASSHEIRQYFFCTDCEERLNKGGEKWILANKLPLRYGHRRVKLEAVKSPPHHWGGLQSLSPLP